jgi:C-terminal processing protease CtpA/Prc
VFDDAYAYFRVRRVRGPLAQDIRSAYRELSQTNKSRIKGAVLDLRFADGGDYAGAGAAADCFMNSDQLLLNWGTGAAHATIKGDSISVPLVVLVNSQTSEAAEALAAALREGGVGLLIGGRTAGQANVFKDFPLANGDKLRIAVGEVKLGNGTAFAGPVEPDIVVNVSSAAEQSYLQDPYRQWLPSKGQSNGAAGGRPTNAVSFHRFNEAELVKEHQQGIDWQQPVSDEPSAPVVSAPVVRDPALARGLDLLKGLSVVQADHPG